MHILRNSLSFSFLLFDLKELVFLILLIKKAFKNFSSETQERDWHSAYSLAVILTSVA